MAVEKAGEKYRCNVCGNEVTVTKVGWGRTCLLWATHGENRRLKKG